MINKQEFQVLRFLKEQTQESLKCNLIEELKKNTSLKTKKKITKVIKELNERMYLKQNILTAEGLNILRRYKVDNAIILAAGSSEMSEKSIYSKPKGLYIKNGETLIERQIRQLKERGIQDITIVIGYKQEMYFYLQEKWNVKLIVNPLFSKTNNIYSLYTASDFLKNTYICNSDNYFPENPFHEYEFRTFHAVVYKEDTRNELLIEKDSKNKITRIYNESSEGLCVYGHAYFDKEFTEELIKHLTREINNFRTKTLFWEEFVNRHIKTLIIYAKEYQDDQIAEFDSIREIQTIGSLFLDNVNDNINQKISEVLECSINAIQNIEILEKGLTNVLFTFEVNGNKYIFRYPSESSSFFINRDNEVLAQRLAAKVSVDKTYIYIDESGMKLSKYVEGIKSLENIYYKDLEFMKRLTLKIKKFHIAGRTLALNNKDYYINPIEQSERFMTEAAKIKTNLPLVFEKEFTLIKELFKYTELDQIEKTICHNDLNQDNCLVNSNSFNIIDWEFASWNDPAYDFGRILAGYDFEGPEIDTILHTYFGRMATPLEKLHWIAYIGIHSWYYLNWALYKESINESSRDWMLFFYNQVKRVLKYALPKYRELYKSKY